MIEQRDGALYATADDGGKVKVLSRWEVCPRCGGEGKHMNPAIAETAYTPEDFESDPDFREAYFSGRYDVTCHECSGLRVVLVPLPDKDQPADVVPLLQAARQYRAELEVERHMARMCGEW